MRWNRTTILPWVCRTPRVFGVRSSSAAFAHLPAYYARLRSSSKKICARDNVSGFCLGEGARMLSPVVTKVVGSFVLGVLATYVVFALQPSAASSSTASARLANSASPTPSVSARGEAPHEESNEVRLNFAAL